MKRRKPDITDYVFAPTGDYYVDSQKELEMWQEKVANLKLNYGRDLTRYYEWRNAIWQKIVGIPIAIILAVAIAFGIYTWVDRGTAASQQAYYIKYTEWINLCEGAGGKTAGPYNNLAEWTCVFPNGMQVQQTDVDGI